MERGVCVCVCVCVCVVGRVPTRLQRLHLAEQRRGGLRRLRRQLLVAPLRSLQPLRQEPGVTWRGVSVTWRGLSVTWRGAAWRVSDVACQ